MKRRSILQGLATLPMAGALNGQQPAIPPKANSVAVEQIPVIEATIPDMAGSTVPSFFSPDRFSALVRFSDAIAPAINGVPGAVAAHAPEFLDFLIGESSADRQLMYNDGLSQLNAIASHNFKTAFAELTKEQVDMVLAPLRMPWQARPDPFLLFLQTAKSDVLQATQNSHEWIRVMSKRVRSAGGLGMYWFPID